MPNKYIKEGGNRGVKVGGPEKPRKQSFMDRVRQLAAMDDKNKQSKPVKGNPEGQKGADLQKMQERANKIIDE